jgi:hypothetical protein
MGAIMNKVMTALVELSGGDEQWKKACEAGVYYVIGTPILGGSYGVGCMETSIGELPNLMPTKAEAEEENQEMIDIYQEQVDEGERDEDDEWDGEVLEARWDGEDSQLHLYSGGHHIYSGDWRDMAGLS